MTAASPEPTLCLIGARPLRLRWYVAMTFAQAEWAALQGVKRLGFQAWLPHYLDSVAAKRWPQGRVKPHLLGYLFVGVEPWQSVRLVKQAAGVWDLVSWRGTPEPVPDAVMAALHRTLDPLVDRPIAGLAAPVLAPGAKARVTEGAFQSFVGIIERIVSGDEVVLWLDLFGRETRVSLSPTALDPLG